MPDSVEYERWLKAQAAREAKKKLDAKRASNVESKLAGAPVQMKWHMKSPAYFHKELTAKYAGVPTYTEEQQDATAAIFASTAPGRISNEELHAVYQTLSRRLAAARGSQSSEQVRV